MGNVKTNPISWRLSGTISGGYKTIENLCSMSSDRTECGLLPRGPRLLHWDGDRDSRLFHDHVGSIVGEFWKWFGAI